MGSKTFKDWTKKSNVLALRPGRFNLIVVRDVDGEEIENLKNLLDDAGLSGVVVDGEVNVIELG